MHQNKQEIILLLEMLRAQFMFSYNSFMSLKSFWFFLFILLCVYYRQPGKLQKFVADLHSGKLHREFHHGPDPEEQTVRILQCREI